MASKPQTDRAKAQQEKFQAILSAQLRDEDNKYCEDCDAKGPRWASWNLGIFLCIRCAGIHRNLGVHISRVKSVNLDSWTPEQVAMMQEMGNSRARAVYEANVPDNFQRPQSNSGLEAFIRAKYENKKYIAREWVPPKPVIPKEWFEDDKAEKKKARNKHTSGSSISSGSSSQSGMTSASATSESRPKPTATVASQPRPSQPQPLKSSSANSDLLGLDAEEPQKAKGGGQGGDLLADLFGGSDPATTAQAPGSSQNTVAAQQNGAGEPNLFDSGNTSNAEGQGEKKSAKDSIMALYGSGGSQQQMFGVPGADYQWAYTASASPYYYYTNTGGMYMPQQQMFGAGGMVPMMQQQQGMMGMQPGMMGQPMQQGMMGMQQQPGGMYGGVGQMGSNMMAGAQGTMMGMPGGQMYMQQQPQQQMMGQVNPMQQQMQFQQMQQQMANMTMGGGQMGGMQQPQQTAVGGGSWGGVGTGQTLSNNLWQ